MESKFNELFSSLGYEALEVILGIHPRSIPETEVMKLVHLIYLSEENEYLESEIQSIIDAYHENPELKLKLLLNLVSTKFNIQQTKEEGQ
jgi:hypothetical protein